MNSSSLKQLEVVDRQCNMVAKHTTQVSLPPYYEISQAIDEKCSTCT